MALLTPLVIATATLAQTGPLPVGSARRVVTLAEGNEPEGIAIDGDGNRYLGNRRTENGERVAEILRFSQDGAVSLFATLPNTEPGANGLLGLAIDGDGDVYAAVDNDGGAGHGVWQISANGQRTELLPGSEQIEFPNAITFDERGRMYVSDSTGSIWLRVTDPVPAFVQWAADPLLEEDPGAPLGFNIPVGANGIAFYPPDNLYVANTERGMIVRVRIEQDGSAGAISVVASGFLLFTVDGIATDAAGDVHGVIAASILLGTSPVVRVDTSTGTVSPTVIQLSEILKIDAPLSLAFGTRAGHQQSVFVANGALRPFPLPIPPAPGVTEVGVGVPGYRAGQ